MDEARASVRDRHLRPAVHRVFDGGLSGEASRGLRHRPGRGVLPRGGQHAPSSRCTCRWSAGANAHHMVEASFKAFARALRAAVADRPARAAACPRPRACCERRRRDPRLRDGQPALASRRRSSTSAREPELTSDHDAVRAADGDRAAGRRAPCRRRWSTMRRAGPRRAARASGWRRACRCSASAWACSCCSSSTTSWAGREGIGLLGGDGPSALDAPGLKMPQIGWNAVSLAARRAAQRRACLTRAPSTTRTRSRRARRTRRTCSAPPTTAASS